MPIDDKDGQRAVERREEVARLRVIELINPIPRGWVNYFAGGAFESELFVCQRLGGEEGPAAPDECPEAEELWLAAVEQAMALRRARADQGLPGSAIGGGAESQSSMHPALHSCASFVETAPQPVSSLEHAGAPSLPVRHFCPCLNQRFLCSRFRSELLVLRLGTQTRLTPFRALPFHLAAE